MVEWIKTEERWEAIAPAWEELLTRGAERYPFLRFSMQRAWWSHRGGGEWPIESALRILVDQDGNGIRGIAPFFRSQDLQNPTYQLLGSLEIMDYLGLLYEESHVIDFCETVCAALADLSTGEWTRVILPNLHASSPILSPLANAARNRGWQTDQTDLEDCPLIPLPGSWDEYLASLDKKQRHEIRRKLRRAEADHQLTLHISTDGSLQADISVFLSLMETDPRKAAFLTSTMRRQFIELTVAAQQNQMLELAFLEVDGQIAAGFFNFDFLDRTWVYNSGMNPQFASLSPGWVLLAKLIQRSIERHQSAFDFMRGNEDYKFHWGGKAQKLAQITILRS
jgi:CelD/BcsL family acetyltransferase involved in cellulose biosynthesis